LPTTILIKLCIEYDDDTTIIPRSTSVIARRLPAARPGKGGAARYVSGKMPVNARSTARADTSSSGRTASGAGNVSSSGVSELDNAQTEDEKNQSTLQPTSQSMERTATRNGQVSHNKY
jgi:Uncharacterized conserved protein, contains RING Zn-finger